MLDVMLDQASRVSFDGDLLAISFPGSAEAMRRQFERADNLATLRRIATAMAGRPAEVRCAAEPNAARGAGEPATPEASSSVNETRRAGGNSKGSRREDPVRADGARALLENAKQNPGVARLLLEFGAQVVDIRTLDAPPPDPEESGFGPSEESR